MKYILKNCLALRSWIDCPNAVLSKYEARAIKIGREKLELLKKCDGITDLEESTTLKRVVEEGYVKEVEEGDRLSEWQKYQRFDNIYIPTIFLRATGVCNFNCKHCFNATDINRDYSRWTLDEFKVLIKQAKECGVHSFSFTGGEPLLNPDFMEIIKEVYRNDMIVDAIATNAFYFTQEFFDELKAIDCNCRFRISFDTLGHHDWMRGEEGVEAKCLEKIKLCIKNHHYTTINCQVNKITMDSVLETADYLESIGVNCIRFIRTTESPRWAKYAGDANLNIKEYFDFFTDFIKKHFSKPRKMEIIIWEFGWFHPNEKSYTYSAMRCDESLYNDKLVTCADRKYEACIGSDGLLFPCHQSSGGYEAFGVEFANVKEIGFKEAIKNPDYLKHARMTTGELIKNATPNNGNSEYLKALGLNADNGYESFDCKTCKHFKQCQGGCRAIGLALGGSFYGPDLFSCIFYKGDYDAKIKEALPSNWKNTIRYAEDASYHEGDISNLPIDECMEARKQERESSNGI